jgi:hypothetical protein
MFWLKGEIIKNNIFFKNTKKKIKNQNNEDQIKKYIQLIWIKWWNWVTIESPLLKKSGVPASPL